jgi:plasmid stabilization system protein ParE
MPRRAWSPKRERQYEHIRDSQREAGQSVAKAEEIAARTVNKQRAQAGETIAAKRARPSGPGS